MYLMSIFSMMFIIHKHISHLIFVLVPECGEYEICNQKIILRSISRQRPFFYWQFSSVIDRNRNRPFHLIQNKVGYRSCFATGVKLGTIFMKQFWRCLILDRKKTAKFWRWPAELIVHLVWRVFFLTLSGISCVTILKYTLILSPQFTKSTENKTSNQKEN